jgi:hypothetical protein
MEGSTGLTIRKCGFIWFNYQKWWFEMVRPLQLRVYPLVILRYSLI